MQRVVMSPSPEDATPVVVLTKAIGDEGAEQFDAVGSLTMVDPASRHYAGQFGIGVVTVEPGRLEAFRGESACRERTKLVAEATAKVRFLGATVAETAAPTAGVLENWGLEALGADRLWAMGVKGDGAVVGHIDAGVDQTHPALDDAVGRFVAFTGGRKALVPDNVVVDSGHGTETAGVIAGRPALNTTGIQMEVGIAPMAKLVCYAIETQSEVTVYEIARSLEVMQGMKLAAICLALEKSQGDDVLVEIGQRIVDAGILPVVAVGNGSESSALNSLPGCLSVGAARRFGGALQHLPGSVTTSFGGRRVPDLVAPGDAVITSVFPARPSGSRYGATTGTSIATAQVAGLAALLRSTFDDATGAEIRRALVESCSWPGPLGPEVGAGMPDAVVAHAKLGAIIAARP
jgi:subtilisin